MLAGQYKNYFKHFLFGMLTLCLLYAGYSWELPYFKFAPSSLGIVFLSFLFYQKKGMHLLGLKASSNFYIFAFLSSIILCLISACLIDFVLKQQGAIMVSRTYEHILVNSFQTLNEEIVFRSLLLITILKFFRNPTQSQILLFVLILPAALFSIIHHLFFSILVNPENQGQLEPLVFVTLFSFGLATNSFFLAFRNILVPWAVHSAWNIARFSFSIQTPSQQALLEYQGFNLIEGSWQICLLSITLAIAGSASLILKNNRNPCKSNL